MDNAFNISLSVVTARHVIVLVPGGDPGATGQTGKFHLCIRYRIAICCRNIQPMNGIFKCFEGRRKILSA